MQDADRQLKALRCSLAEQKQRVERLLRIAELLSYDAQLERRLLERRARDLARFVKGKSGEMMPPFLLLASWPLALA